MIFSCAVSFESKKKKNSGFIAATLYSGQLRGMFKLSKRSERKGLHICDMKYTCNMEYSNLLILK
jgi:hypothetical protein